MVKTVVDSGYKHINDMIIASQNNAKNDSDSLYWIDFSELSDFEELDSGAFGTVYKATLDNDYYSDLIVAVKFFDDYKYFIQEFTNIYRMIKRCSDEDLELSSSNIIHYYGATYDDNDEQYGIVMDYCPQSSLSNYLDNDWEEIYWTEKLQILRDISYGLYTLHNNDLIHGDLHSGNIMIDNTHDSGVAWLGDLGFCREEEKGRKRNGFNGVIPFIAPEVLQGYSYSKKADIYSFGIIMYRVSTNRAPFHNRAHNSKLMNRICNGLRPTLYRDDEIPLCFENLMRNCWNADAKNRPNTYTLYRKFDYWLNGEEFEDVEWNTIPPIDESKFNSGAIYTSRTWN